MWYLFSFFLLHKQQMSSLLKNLVSNFPSLSSKQCSLGLVNNGFGVELILISLFYRFLLQRVLYITL